MNALVEIIRRARPAWWEQAACRTPRARALVDAGRADFFPERGRSAGLARDICATCDVADHCLAEAGRWERSIRGGLTQAERRRLEAR